MSHGTFFTFGFFAIANGVRQPVVKPVSPTKKASSTPSASSSTWYNFYSTTIQYSDAAAALPAQIRVYSPPGDLPLAEDTIAFMVAKVHIPDKGLILLDAICMHPLPGNPQSSDYEDGAPDMLYPYVYGIGTSKGKAETLADGKSKGFTVLVEERVRDKQEKSSVFCVLDGISPRWVNVPPPSPNSLISFLGVCSGIRADGKLTIALEMVSYNPSPAAPPSSPPLADPSPQTPSVKRRKFVAFQPSSSPVAGPSNSPACTSARAPSQPSAPDTPADDAFDSDLSPVPSREDVADNVLKQGDDNVANVPPITSRAKAKRKAL